MRSDDASTDFEVSSSKDHDILSPKDTLIDVCNIKGILKKKSSKPGQVRKSIQFNEQNIIQTYLMTGRNYDYIKIKEHRSAHEEEGKGAIDRDELMRKLQKAAREQAPTFGDEDLSDDDFFEPIHEKAHRMEFELRRKEHYKEYEQVALARRLIMEDFGSDGSTDEYDFTFESLFKTPKCYSSASEENPEEPGGTTDALIETQSSQQGDIGEGEQGFITIDEPGQHDSETTLDPEHPCFGRIRDL